MADVAAYEDKRGGGCTGEGADVADSVLLRWGNQPGFILFSLGLVEERLTPGTSRM